MAVYVSLFINIPWSSGHLKESYAWEASRRSKMIGEEALGLLQSHIEREKDPSLVGF